MENVLIANKLVSQLYKKELSAQIFRIVFCRVNRSFGTYKTSKLQNVSHASTKAPLQPKIHPYSPMTSNNILGKRNVLFFQNHAKWIPESAWKTYITLVKKVHNITDPGTDPPPHPIQFFGRHLLIFWPILMIKVSKCSGLHSASYEMEP